MSTISYKEIVRKVHPDLNPDIKDAGAKMAEIQKNKSNPSALFSLAVKWGLVNGGSSYTYTHTRTENKSSTKSDFRADNKGNITLQEEACVSVFFRGKRYVGKIKKVRTIKKGYCKGGKEFTIALTNGRVVCVKKNDVYPDIYIDHYNLTTTLDAWAEETWKKYENQRQRAQEEKERSKERRAERIKDQVGVNKGYAHFGGKEVYVFVKTKQNWFRVVRTTNKSVFYLDRDGNEKRCQFSSVLHVNEK